MIPPATPPTAGPSTTARPAGNPVTAPAAGNPATAPAAGTLAAPADAPLDSWIDRARTMAREYFQLGNPTFTWALLPAIVVSALLFTRSPYSNFIFDEQEALLANPYVNAKNLRFIDVVHRDFWGLLPDRSIGSYRPIPNMVWRAIASTLRFGHDVVSRGAKADAVFAFSPWVFHWFNVVIHGVNAALLVAFVWRVTGRRAAAWLAGASFVSAAVITEAVSGVVGTADVLGGLGAMLALSALLLPLGWMPLGVLGAMLFGLFSKESTIVCVPLVPLAALLLAPQTHAERPLRIVRSGLSLVVCVAALVTYVELRKRWFPAPLPADLKAPLAADAGRLHRWAHAGLVWFHQPPLPRDPLNNPLVSADVPHRIAGALRVYWRGLVQVVFPRTLSGDYSFPQEPVPDTLVFPESILGALGMVLPLLVAPVLWIVALVRKRSTMLPLAALGLVWIVVSYFPHSNIPVLLPTVRAERFWYFPVIGSSILLGCAFAWLVGRFGKGRDGAAVGNGAGLPSAAAGAPASLPPFAALGAPASPTFGDSHRAPDAQLATGSQADRRGGFVAAVTVVTLFFGFQCVRARTHALDYADDLIFWGATKVACPRSAKAHLNYSVMWGARGNLDTRLAENRIAADLAPKWTMAHVYLGDTLCRMHRAAEAWPHYAHGFEIGENDLGLIALGLQCMWDEKAFAEHQEELVTLADKHKGSWLDYLVKDMVDNGEEHGGVDPKYRPRGYNEGPKE